MSTLSGEQTEVATAVHAGIVLAVKRVCGSHVTSTLSNEQAEVATAVHAGMVLAVKRVCGSHVFANDVWLNYTHAHAPLEWGQERITLDPQKYSAGFLGDFLQYVAGRSQDATCIDAFLQRPVAKVPRIAKSAMTQVPTIDFVWIVVGDEVLQPPAWLQFQRVALSSSYVHHSGVAVGMLLNCVYNGILERTLGVKLSQRVKYGCVHCEGKFAEFPKQQFQSAHLSRIDNVNSCFRAWGVDARATSIAMQQAVRSNLHPDLEHFLAVGVNRHGSTPCFHIEPEGFLQSLMIQKKKVLHDGLLVEQLFWAQRGYDNGISTWYHAGLSSALLETLKFYGADKPRTLVLVLSPEGVPLKNDTAHLRLQPDDIWVQQ